MTDDSPIAFLKWRDCLPAVLRCPSGSGCDPGDMSSADPDYKTAFLRNNELYEAAKNASRLLSPNWATRPYRCDPDSNRL